MSIRPGCPKSGSARGRPFKCFHLTSKGTGYNGRSHVTRGTITAETLYFLVGADLDDKLRFVTAWKGELQDNPATPEILVF
jgi:hypothetical protein